MDKPRVTMRGIGTSSTPAYLVFLEGKEVGMVEKAGFVDAPWAVYLPGYYFYNGHFTTVRTRRDAVNALLPKGP